MKLLGSRPARALLLASAVLIIFSASASADYFEGFDSFSDSGWRNADLSDSTGAGSWNQGRPRDTYDWRSYSGEPDSFAEDSPDGREFGENKVSDWLISPRFDSLSNGDLLSFQMRAMWLRFNVDQPVEVRLSTGECSPGDTADSVGDFDRVIGTVNTGTYHLPFEGSGADIHISVPVWAEFSMRITGLARSEHAGCLAFRHSSPYTGFLTTRVGVDDFRLADGEPSDDRIEPLRPYPRKWSGGPWPLTHLRVRANPGATVGIYTNDACQGSPSTVADSARFEWLGVDVNLTANAENDLAATSTDAEGNVSKCFPLEIKVRHDGIPPSTSDDVATGSSEYPAPVNLTAVDNDSGVVRTYYSTDELESPWAFSKIYDPEHPPVLQPGQRIRYFSVDNAGNREDAKESPYAPFPAPKPADGGVSANQAASPPVARLSRGAVLIRRGDAQLEITCVGDSAAGSCTGTASILTAVGKKLHPRLAEFSVPAGARQTVSVPLTPAALRFAARGAHRSTPWVYVSLSGSGGVARLHRKLVLRLNN